METSAMMSKQQKGKLYIGTSNITLPGNKQTFPAAFADTSRLHYYASLFDSLEVNSSFYKVPMPATFGKWAEDVSPEFRFSIKLWKEITHIKELNFDPENVVKFLTAAERLGNSKGCLLLQFPGKISFAYFNQLEKLLNEIRYEGKGAWQTAVEFRNVSWYVSETMELLDEYGSSMVLHDIPKSKSVEPNRNAPVVYIRYHGPAGDYRGSYNDEFLLQQSSKIKAWLKKGKDVYAYFNNTIGNAFENAMTLRKMTEFNG